MNSTLLRSVLGAVALSAAHGTTATISPENGYGPNPRLPAPDRPIIPTVVVAEAKGWPAGKMPTPADGSGGGRV